MFETFHLYLKDKIELSAEQLEAIKTVFTPKRVQRGEVLLHPGKMARQVMFVNRGCLRSYVLDNKGKEYIIQFAPENWWITDQNSIFMQEPAMFFIDAIEESDLLVADREFQQKLEAIHTDFGPLFQRLLRNNFRALQKRLVNQLVASAEERYLDFLNTYPDLARRLPQRMIASYLGVVPESLSRIRKELAGRSPKT